MKIYHNKRCSKSRKALSILNSIISNLEIIDYIKNPITGQIVNGTVTIEVEASDNTTIQYVSILVNNEIKVTHLSEPYSYQWNTENETDDLVYSIYAVIVDIDNNRTTIPPISVTVNNLDADLLVTTDS